MKKNIDYSIYLVTDKDLMTSETVEESVELAILGGATLIQIREKDSSCLDFYQEALRVKKICDDYGVGLIINDRIDVALAVNADGVHVGQSDLPAKKVREIIGKDMILGVSATTKEEALKAEKDGADYLGVGAMFETGTKTDAKIVTKQELAEIKKAVTIPIVIIGGINEKTIPLFDGMDIDGVAVVSAIVAKSNITAAARNIKKIFYNSRKSIIDKNMAIFDLDGTLLDSLGVWIDVDKKFFKKRGLKMPSDFIDVTMPLSFLETAEYVIEKFKFNDSAESIVEEWYNLSIEEYTKNIKLKPYAKEYLEELKSNGVKIIIATSLSKELYQPVLKLNRIEHLFDKTFSVNEVGVGKNSGKIYEYAMNEMGEKAESCILFEDIPNAALSGKNLGLTVVGIKDKANRQTIAKLSQICDYLLTDFYNAPIILPINK